MICEIGVPYTFSTFFGLGGVANTIVFPDHSENIDMD